MNNTHITTRQAGINIFATKAQLAAAKANARKVAIEAMLAEMPNATAGQLAFFQAEANR